MQRLASSGTLPRHILNEETRLTKSCADLPVYNKDYADNSYRLTIFSHEQFIPKEDKKMGSRPGAIGYLTPNQQQRYMLKEENFHYISAVTTCAAESVALESLCSKLIRFIFGDQYAANIDLIKIPVTMKTENAYAILSRWEENCEIPDDLAIPHEGTLPDEMKPYAIMVTRIQTIAKLINMGDFKPDNIVKRSDRSLFLVDCSGLLNGYVNLNSFYQPDWLNSKINLGNLLICDTVTETIKTFLAADFEKLTHITMSYNCVLSQTTIKKLLHNIHETIKMCEKLPTINIMRLPTERPDSTPPTSPGPSPRLFALTQSNSSNSGSLPSLNRAI